MGRRSEEEMRTEAELGRIGFLPQASSASALGFLAFFLAEAVGRRYEGSLE